MGEGLMGVMDGTVLRLGPWDKDDTMVKVGIKFSTGYITSVVMTEAQVLDLDLTYGSLVRVRLETLEP